MTKETYLAILGERLRPHLSEEEYQDVMQYYSEYFDEAGPKREEETVKELGTPEALAERILGEQVKTDSSRREAAPEENGESQKIGSRREAESEENEKSRNDRMKETDIPQQDGADAAQKEQTQTAGVFSETRAQENAGDAPQPGSKKNWKLSIGWIIAIAIIGAPLWITLFGIAIGLIVMVIALLVVAVVMAVVFIILCTALVLAGIWLLFRAFANGLVTIGAALLLGGIGILLLMVFAGVYGLLKKGYQAIRERRRNRREENA